MDYKYRITIMVWKPYQHSGWYQNGGYYDTTCHIDITFPDDENVKQFVERYGSTLDAFLFLNELLNLCSSKPSQEQTANLTSLDYKTLTQKAEELLKDRESLQIAKQELEKQVSTLSRTKENREVEKLREEKADLKHERDQLTRDNKNFESQLAQLQRKLEDLQQQLSGQQTQNNNYYQAYQESERKYNELVLRWNKLIQDYEALQKRLTGTHTIEQENEKLKKSRQTLENRVQEIEKELQETQQKLSLATMRLRGINTHPELVGESRSDQLKNEFSHIKSTLHEVSSIVLNGWKSQGFKSKARSDFKSEEFFTIKSILSRRVFGDGMNYFAQDKTEVDSELHLIMDALSDIKDFSPTPAIFHEIQEKVQVGLLRAKGVDHSDEAIEQYIEETTQRIDQDLKLIANLETTSEALSEIKKFVKTGLKIVRDIVNDTNSGELFIPENGTTFDDNAHDTRDDHQGLIKMTICAGYRIKGTILVKADVMTHEPEPTSPTNPQDSANGVTDVPEPTLSNNSQGSVDDHQPDDPQTPESQDGTQEPQTTEVDDSKVKATENTFKSPPDQEGSPPTESSSPKIFKGKVTCNAGVSFRSRPQKEPRTASKAAYGEVLNFEGWIFGEPWKETISPNQELDNRWYKLAGQNYWLPAFYIEGAPPSDLKAMESTGGGDEAQ